MCLSTRPPFRDYLDDVDSVGCCRSASLLLPARDAAAVLGKLRELDWVNAHVLVRPWASNRGKRSSIQARHSDDAARDTDTSLSCLPSASDVVHVAKRFGLPETMSTRDGLAQFHTESKSLVVPLSEEATIFILREMFDLSSTFSEVEAGTRMANDDFQARHFVQQMVNTNRVTLVHNCEGSQLVSLSKEEDVFPTSQCRSSSSEGPDQFTFIDLFAGIGGFRSALESLGGVCVGSCELDQYARDTYRLNFSCEEEFFVNDIARMDVPLHYADLLCGGFPCQSFSTMSNFDGGGEGTRQGGLETRGKGHLFFQLLRVLRDSKPKVFIFENVKGLVKMQGGEHLDRVLRLLRESGYNVSYGVIDAAWFLPQRRERVFFTGVRLDLLSEECSVPVDFAALKRKYQLYASNEIDHSKDKFDRVLLRCSARTPRPPNDNASSIGDCLETGLEEDSLPFLTAAQWDKVSNQSYTQLHADGSGRLVTQDEACVQTIITSYRQSYLMHSQFLVTRNNIFHHQQNDKLVGEALKRKPHYAGSLRASCSSDKIDLNATLPRFFTPREW